MVHRHYLSNSLLLILLLCISPVMAESEMACQTVKDVDAMNKGGVSRLFELQGVEAKIFLALDPRLLMYEELFHSLMLQDIDTIVAWKLKRRSSLAAAVPFAGRCAAHGYGEPDWQEKIDLMRDVVILIRKRGLDDQRVLDKMTKLVAFEQSAAAPGKLEKQVEQLIERVRSLYESDIEAAVRKGDLDEVRQLIDAGTDINTKDETGATPLHWAADASHTAIAELLISKGADANATANDGFRPLHLAANTGNTAIAELLITNGADVDAKNKVGLTPRDFAVTEGHKKLADLLQEHEAQER